MNIFNSYFLISFKAVRVVVMQLPDFFGVSWDDSERPLNLRSNCPQWVMLMPPRQEGLHGVQGQAPQRCGVCPELQRDPVEHQR